MSVLTKGLGESHRKLVPWLACAFCALSVASFAWSTFYPYLMTYFDVAEKAPFALGASVLGFFNMLVVPPIFGPMVDKYGPKPVLFTGAVAALLGGACMSIMMSNADWGSAQIWWYVGSALFGITAGTGASCHASMAQKWNPDKAGLATGIALVGPTLGTFWMAPVVTALVPSIGIAGTFWVIAIIAAAGLTIFGVIPMRLPDEGWKPEGWNPPVKKDASETPGLTLSQALRGKEFWMLFACMLFVTFGCFLFAMNLSFLSIEGIGTLGGADIAIVTAQYIPLIMMVTAVFNSGARPVWGAILGKLGCWKTLIICYVGLAATLVLFRFLYTSFAGCLVGAILVYCFFGGTAALHMAAAGVLFGPKDIGTILGVTQIAVGLGWVIGPYAGAFLADMTGTYQAPLFVAAGLAVVGVVIAAIMSKTSNNTAFGESA